MNTLILNCGYEPLKIVNWKHGICMVLSNRAEPISFYEKKIRTVSLTFKVPKVIKLKKYAYLSNISKLIKYSKKNILKRDRYICQYCGEVCKGKNATIDHVIPKSSGGKSNWTNVVTACYSCNNKKGSKSLKEANMKLLSKPDKPYYFLNIDTFYQSMDCE